MDNIDNTIQNYVYLEEQLVMDEVEGSEFDENPTVINLRNLISVDYEYDFTLFETVENKSDGICRSIDIDIEKSIGDQEVSSMEEIIDWCLNEDFMTFGEEKYSCKDENIDFSDDTLVESDEV